MPCHNDEYLAWIINLSLPKYIGYAVYDVCMVPMRQERPYHSDSTASRLLSEVKHCRARLVLRWGTTLESLVLFFCSFCLTPPFHFGPCLLRPPCLPYNTIHYLLHLLHTRICPFFCSAFRFVRFGCRISLTRPREVVMKKLAAL